MIRPSRTIWTTLLLSLCLSCVAAGAGDTVSALRQQELLYLLRQDCGSCHGMTLKGGLGPPLLPESLKDKPHSYLHYVIAKGIPEKAMPPWENILTPLEIDFLVTQITEHAPRLGMNP